MKKRDCIVISFGLIATLYETVMFFLRKTSQLETLMLAFIYAVALIAVGTILVVKLFYRMAVREFENCYNELKNSRHRLNFEEDQAQIERLGETEKKLKKLGEAMIKSKMLNKNQKQKVERIIQNL